MPFPAVKCFVSMGIFGEYDNSCTGEGMPSPYNQKQNLTDKWEFVLWYFCYYNTQGGKWEEPMVISSTWYYYETVYSAYSPYGELIFRSSVDATPDHRPW